MMASRRIKVALVGYRDDPRLGGALRVAEMLALYLPRDQVELHLVFTYGQAGPVSRRVNVPVHYLNAPSSRHLASWWRTRSWFARQSFDLVHFVDPVNWLFFATIGLGLRRIDHFHGSPSPAHVACHHQLIHMCRRWLNDAGIAITYGARRGVGRMGWMSPARIHVVQNGVSAKQFEEMPRREDARRQLKLPADAVLFGAVARFSAGNGLHEFIDILKYLPTNWHAVLVGDGPLREDLQETARQQGLDHRLHMPGLLDDVRPAYASLDMVVLLARYQSFCLMLAEAMLARVPVIGLQGAGEYTEPEYPLITQENAIFFPRVNPWDFESVEPADQYHTLALAMQEMLNRPEETARRVKHAAEWVTNRFSAEKQAQGCLRVYRHVMGKEYSCVP